MTSMLDPTKMAFLATTVYATQQTTFFMYHYNSHAANPIMLRSTKPQVMRDFFLVPCNLGTDEWYRFLNPLPGVYNFSIEDAMANSLAMTLVGFPLIKTIGMGHVSAVYALGAIFSGFAYVFQMQCSRTKKSTDFDCAASSQGAVAALCSLSLLMPNQRIPGPWVRPLPSSIFAAAFIIRGLVEEYGTNPFNAAAYHKWFRTSALARKSTGGEHVSGTTVTEDEVLENKFFKDNNSASSSAWEQSADYTGHIELTNWGSIGGIFLGLIYGSLVIGVKKDFSRMGRFWGRMPGMGGGGATARKGPPPPSWSASK